MGLNQQRFEQTLVSLDLALQLLVLFGTEARLFFVGHNVVDIDFRAVCAQDRAAEPALLHADNARLLPALIRLLKGAHSAPSPVPMMRSNSKHKSPCDLSVAFKSLPRF